MCLVHNKNNKTIRLMQNQQRIVMCTIQVIVVARRLKTRFSCKRPLVGSGHLQAVDEVVDKRQLSKPYVKSQAFNSKIIRQVQIHFQLKQISQKLYKSQTTIHTHAFMVNSFTLHYCEEIFDNASIMLHKTSGNTYQQVG